MSDKETIPDIAFYGGLDFRRFYEIKKEGYMWRRHPSVPPSILLSLCLSFCPSVRPSDFCEI